MSTPNEDALRCAGDLEKIVSVFGTPSSRNAERDSAAHIRRLVAENETLKETLVRGREVWIASAETWSRDVAEKDALLRQAVEALEGYASSIQLRNHQVAGKVAIKAIRQHMEGKA